MTPTRVMIDGMRSRIPPVVAVLLLGAVAGAGLIPLLELGEDTPSEVTAVAGEPMRAPGIARIAIPPSSPTRDLESASVSRSIARVLFDTGYANHVSRASLESELDGAIIRVLESVNAVLTVFDQGGGR